MSELLSSGKPPADVIIADIIQPIPNVSRIYREYKKILYNLFAQIMNMLALDFDVLIVYFTIQLYFGENYAFQAFCNVAMTT